MKCPKCDTTYQFKVINTRLRENGDIYRRRECIKCGNRITTYEVIARKDDKTDMDSYKKLLNLVQDLEMQIIKMSKGETK